MKKIICILLATVVIFAFAACGNKDTEETTSEQTTEVLTTVVPTTEVTTTEIPTTEVPTTAVPTTAAPTTAAPTTAVPTTAVPTTATPTTAAPTTSKTAKNVSLSSVRSVVLQASGISGEMDIPGDQLTDLYGISQNDIKQSAGFMNMNGAFPEEVVMIEAKDASAAKRIASLLQTRLDDVKVQSQSYDPDSYAVVQECKIIENGNYVAMFLAKSHQQMENAFVSEIE